MADYHVAGFKKAGAEVVAIADPDPEAAEAAADRYNRQQGPVNRFTDYFAEEYK